MDGEKARPSPQRSRSTQRGGGNDCGLPFESLRALSMVEGRIAECGLRIALRPFDTLRVAPSVVEGREPPLDTLGAVSTVEPQGPEPFDHAHGPEPVEGHGRRAD